MLKHLPGATLCGLNPTRARARKDGEAWRLASPMKTLENRSAKQQYQQPTQSPCTTSKTTKRLKKALSLPGLAFASPDFEARYEMSSLSMYACSVGLRSCNHKMTSLERLSCKHDVSQFFKNLLGWLGLVARFCLSDQSTITDIRLRLHSRTVHGGSVPPNSCHTWRNHGTGTVVSSIRALWDYDLVSIQHGMLVYSTGAIGSGSGEFRLSRNMAP